MQPTESESLQDYESPAQHRGHDPQEISATLQSLLQSKQRLEMPNHPINLEAVQTMSLHRHTEDTAVGLQEQKVSPLLKKPSHLDRGKRSQLQLKERPSDFRARTVQSQELSQSSSYISFPDDHRGHRKHSEIEPKGVLSPGGTRKLGLVKHRDKLLFMKYLGLSRAMANDNPFGFFNSQEKRTGVDKFEDNELEMMGLDDYLLQSASAVDTVSQSSHRKEPDAVSVRSEDSLMNEQKRLRLTEKRKIILRRLLKIRQVTIAMLAILVIQCIEVLISPYSLSILILKLVQLVVNLVLLAFVLASYRSEQATMRYMHNVFLITIAQMLCLILENYVAFNRFSHSYLNCNVVFTQHKVILGIAIYNVMFQHMKGQRIVGVIQVLVNSSLVIANFQDIHSPLKHQEYYQLAFDVIVTNVFILYGGQFFLQINRESEAQMKRSLENQKEFKYIFENFQEPLMIMTSTDIEFVNDNFLFHFSKILKQATGFKEDFPDVEFRPLRSQEIPSISSLASLLLQTVGNLGESIKIAAGRENKEQAEEKSVKLSHPLLQRKMFRIYQEGDKPSSNDHMMNETPANAPSSIPSSLEPAEEEDLSICDLLQMEGEYLQDMKLQLLQPEESTPKYIRVKVTRYMRFSREKIILQFIDITNEILQDQYRLQNELLGMINACVSHELRNPLNSIAAQNIEKERLYELLGELLDKHRKDYEGHAQIPREMKQLFGLLSSVLDKLTAGIKVQVASTEMMTYMVQDLLDYAQIKAGKFRKNITQFDIRQAVESVMCVQRKKAADQGLDFVAIFENFECDIDSASLRKRKSSFSKPRTKTFSPMVSTDESRIKQVLLGLQSNALKFTQKGRVEIRSKILVLKGEKFLQISVVDTGIGIPHDQQDKLFKLFGFVQDSKQLNTKGIGLGLVIADQIVTQFGGSINFKSDPGVGSKFSFSFKLEEEIPASDLFNEAKTKFELNSLKLVFKWNPRRQGFLSRKDSVRIKKIESGLFSSLAGRPLRLDYSAQSIEDIPYVANLHQQGGNSTSIKKRPPQAIVTTPSFSQKQELQMILASSRSQNDEQMSPISKIFLKKPRKRVPSKHLSSPYATGNNSIQEAVIDKPEQAKLELSPMPYVATPANLLLYQQLPGRTWLSDESSGGALQLEEDISFDMDFVESHRQGIEVPVSNPKQNLRGTAESNESVLGHASPMYQQFENDQQIEMERSPKPKLKLKLSMVDSESSNAPDDTRILIVDDQGFNLDALEIILSYSCHIDCSLYVDRALSGSEAIELVKNNLAKYNHKRSDYALILMDCNMPFLDGYQTCDAIRKIFFLSNLPQPIISAVTGHCEQAYIEKAINSGMNQVLSKPVKSEALSSVLDQLGFARTFKAALK